jgi:diguanylate cyclase (GGDEF)-like protein
MVPVIFDGKTPVAFVGLMDRRHPIRLSRRAIDDADAVLSVLAGYIKTRVYQKRLEHANKLMKRMAENDALTSLPNRRKFMADIKESIERMKKNGSTGYLLFMDLDDFKNTNDTLGHLAGDTLLCRIGEFLYGERETLGMPYRYGGDEFVILAEHTGPDGLNNIRDILLRRFSASWPLGEHAVPCGISIGAVSIPQGHMPVEELIRAADSAMYDVKRSGKQGFREFNKNMFNKNLDK